MTIEPSSVPCFDGGLPCDIQCFSIHLVFLGSPVLSLNCLARDTFCPQVEFGGAQGCDLKVVSVKKNTLGFTLHSPFKYMYLWDVEKVKPNHFLRIITMYS